MINRIILIDEYIEVYNKMLAKKSFLSLAKANIIAVVSDEEAILLRHIIV